MLAGDQVFQRPNNKHASRINQPLRRFELQQGYQGLLEPACSAGCQFVHSMNPRNRLTLRLKSNRLDSRRRRKTGILNQPQLAQRPRGVFDSARLVVALRVKRHTECLAGRCTGIAPAYVKRAALGRLLETPSIGLPTLSSSVFRRTTSRNLLYLRHLRLITPRSSIGNDTHVVVILKHLRHLTIQVCVYRVGPLAEHHVPQARRPLFFATGIRPCSMLTAI